ncbi:acetylhydrolase [Streptomyces sp. NPDC089919]|uniref:alpha/beta hydrolase family protein n=1 Tax=Streptomyces sp. NPDC089919 TaxID=3155188 RepID=UPI003434D472
MTSTPAAPRTSLTRRRVLATALAAGTAAATGTAVPAAASGAPVGRADAPPAHRGSTAPAGPGPVPLTLPAPTGPYPVGTVSLRLVDPARPDPAAGSGRCRELMAGLWYPARVPAGGGWDAHRYPRAPWMSEGVLRAFLAEVGFPLDPALGPLTAARTGAPVLRTDGDRLPVVVYAHGAGSHRGDHTITVQELASHGYLVVTVGHTHDTFAEFPDGRVITPDDVPMYPRDFATDLRFLLDCVERLAAGHNPDADGAPLPRGLRGAPDPRRIGAFGWSKGGTATALALLADRRIRAGLSLDAPMEPLITTDVDRPFMLMTASFPREGAPAVAEFWDHLRGWRLDVRADGAVHPSYGDNATLIPQAGRLLGMSEEQIQEMVGTLDPARAVRIQQAYPLAFFDRHLRHRRAPLLDGPSRAFPEVRFPR